METAEILHSSSYQHEKIQTDTAITHSIIGRQEDIYLF